MKKTSILLSLLTVGAMSFAQTTRLSLYEEFTGENCPPCASTNPGLQVVLNANTSKATSLKWEVPIPSAPSNTWSLYQTNITEINWRYRSTTSGGYGYPSQNTSTSSIVSGVNSAPSGRIDGQHQWAFGATQDHPAVLTGVHLTNSSNIMSPFSVTLTRAWDPSYTAVTVTVNITAAQTFTCAGPLIFRLCMVEQEVHFASASGTNGEKDFFNPVRKSFPTLQTGTSLPTSWTSGQNQTFTVNCPLPAYITDKSMVNMIGFIQDDATRIVHQAAKTTTVGIPNDASAVAVSGNFITCGSSYTPSVIYKNNGANTITTMTVNPFLDGTPQTPFNWSGSLAAGATVAVNMPALTPANGLHTYSVSITQVNGGPDANTANNNKSGQFMLVSSYAPAPISQSFSLTTFPPANWAMYNPDGGTATWSRIGTVGAYAVAPLGCAKYDFYNNSSTTDKDDLILPPADFTGLTNMKLTFDVAYAQYSTELDQLDVLVSTNCGSSWTNVYSKAGSVLSTAPAVTSVFTPSSTQWRSEVVNLGAYDGNATVLVKFVASSKYGNNMYIDNVNLVSTTGIKAVNNNSSIELFPNPASSQATVRINATEASELNITFFNAVGQLVSQKTVTTEVGANEISFDVKALADGIYNVVIADKAGNSTVKKLTINK